MPSFFFLKEKEKRKIAIGKKVLGLDHVQNTQKQIKSSVVRDHGDGIEAVVQDIIQLLLRTHSKSEL